MPDFSIYVQQEVFVLIPVLWFITYLLKITPNLPGWTIPWILVVCGIIGSISILGTFDSNAVLQGIMVAAVNVLGNKLAEDTVSGLRKSGKG
jgi:hypothetical protein